MFAKLVESSSHRGDYARSGKFFLATLSIYALAFLAIGVGSIYAYNAQLDTNNLELTSLVAPVEQPEIQMLRVRPAASRPASGPSNNSPRVAVVKSPPVMTTSDPRVAPVGVAVAPPRPELPAGTDFKIGNPGHGDIFGGTGNGPGNGPGNVGSSTGPGVNEIVAETPPPPVKKEAVKPPEPARIVSKGVINGSAIELPKPAYSAIAKAAHASGTVTVQVLIDENGKVISAHALNGHPLLLAESVQAALRARFSPTLLSNQPVKVSGMITYKFVM